MAKRRKSTWKNIALIALCGVVGAGALSCIGALANTEDDYKRVYPSYYIGGLDDDGLYEETTESIYTKKALTVEAGGSVYADLDFDATVSYQIFFYGEDDEFLSSSDVLKEDKKITAPEGAESFRVEITPEWSDDVDEDDQEVTVLNQFAFSSQLVLSVAEASDVEDSSTSE